MHNTRKKVILSETLIIKDKLHQRSSRNRLLQLRILFDLSIKEAAQKSNTTAETWSKHEKLGDFLSVNLCLTISNAFNIPPWYIGGYDLMKENTVEEKLLKARHMHYDNVEQMLSFFKLDSHGWKSKILESLYLTNYLMILNKNYVDLANKIYSRLKQGNKYNSP